MMNQEQYVKIKDLRAQGWTNKEIAEATGFHPATISARLNAEEPPSPRRQSPAPVLDERWRERIAGLVEAYPRLLGVSVHNKLAAEGFVGGYSTITRALRDVRGPRFRPADRVSVPIVTDPGEEAQFDFCDLSGWAQRWGWPTPLWCFGMILCWARWRMWWFTTSQDRQHTFEGMARFFDAAGGVPVACRTDRMGALGRSQGARFVLHPPTTAFAAHYATAVTSCQARDAKRKGKVERPFRQLRETFLSELDAAGPPADIAELNTIAQHWLDERVHAVASRTTGETPAVRLGLERPFLHRLPRVRFDTDYVESRRVHNIIPFIHVAGKRFSVPGAVLGQRVEVRRPVDSTSFDISWAGRLARTHQLDTTPGADGIVWHPEDRAAATSTALQRHSHSDNTTDNKHADSQRTDDRQAGRHLRIVNTPPLDLDGDFDVDAVDLDGRYGAGSIA
jgi:transposase